MVRHAERRTIQSHGADTNIQAVGETSRGRGVLFPASYTELAEFNKPTLEGILICHQNLLKGAIAVSGEITAFATARLRKNVETLEAVAKCRTVTEAVELQRGVAETATKQYYEEARKLGEMASRIAQDSWTPLADGTRETFKRLSVASREASDEPNTT
jgi:hypothetical protein